MSNLTVIEKLTLIKRVAGYVNLGVIPSDRFVDKADSYLDDLSRADAPEPMDLTEAKRAIAAVKSRVMPSQEVCIRGMQEVDRYLAPLRQARRQALAQASAESSVPQRPRS